MGKSGLIWRIVTSACSISFSSGVAVSMIAAHEPQTAGSQWLWDVTRALDWGTVPYQMVIRDQYDGIVFIDSTSPPKYIQ